MKITMLKQYWVVIGGLILLVLINYFLSVVSLRIDLSKGQAYTLSPSSKKVIQQLGDKATITLFASSELPARFAPIKRDVVDLLGEYRAQSAGKINVVEIDPKKDEKKLKEAQEYGIREVQFSQQEQDKFAVSTAYFGIGITFKNKKESIPVASNPTELEYIVTSLIYKMSAKNPILIGMIGVENQDERRFTTLTALLNQQFDLTQSATIEAKYKTLLVFDTPNKIYNDEEIASLNSYLEKGGKVIFFIDGVWIGEQAADAQSAGHNLFSLLNKWGINLQKDLVLSTSSELVNLGSQNGFPVATQYPFWVVSNVFDGPTSYYSNVQAVSFPWVSSLKPVKQKDIVFTPLLKTNTRSWHQTASFTIEPNTIREPDVKDLSSFLVGAKTEKQKTKSVVAVIASSRFVQDQFVSGRVNNFEYVLNLTSDLASDGLLSGIKARSVDIYPLPTLSASTKDMFKYFNMFLLPGIFGAYGIYRLTRKKSK